jgi:quercetin dioxygenase-like cupin family protein
VKVRQISDHEREQVALHALGALEPDEARGVDEQIEGDGALAGEVAALRAVAGSLALAAPAVAPQAGLRERLLAHATGRTVWPSPGLEFMVEGDGAWEDVRPGMQRRVLAGDPTHPAAYLVRLAAGARAPRHRHAAAEHCYVLSGEMYVLGRHLRAGDYHRAAAGTVHDGMSTREGCLFLVVEAQA